MVARGKVLPASSPVMVQMPLVSPKDMGHGLGTVGSLLMASSFYGCDHVV
jgi:hypothetical protein